MDAIQKGILTLIRSAVTGESLPLPEGFDLAQAYPLIKRHQIEAMAYDGAVRCGISADLPIMQQLFGRYCRILLCSEKQMAAIEALCKAFDAHGIDYMPLKGCNLKKLYPKPELRQMGDADILIRMQQYEQVRAVTLEQGFQEKVEGEYDYVWHSPSLKLELHKFVIGESNRDFYGYFGNGWNLALPERDSRHMMCPEDQFLYLFTHMTKHYRDGGVGLRHITDLWVYRTAIPVLDEAHIRKGMQKMHLLEFYENICSLIRVWFEDADSNEKTEFMTEYLFQSGSWGTAAAHTVAEGMKDVRHAGGIRQGRFRRVWKSAFPGLRIMRHRYPILDKYPVLMPFLWPVRLVTAVLFRRDHLRKQKDGLNSITSEQIQTYQQALNYVGLDFHFKD